MLAPMLVGLSISLGLLSLFLLYVAGSNWHDMRKYMPRVHWRNYQDAFFLNWLRWSAVTALVSLACFYAGVYAHV